ncbi:MAG: ABC transporter permease subunit [Clostridia bacterium]
MWGKIKQPVRKLIAAVFWLIVWQCAAFAVGNQLLLPGPYATIKCLAELVPTVRFWRAVGMTLLRVAGGFLLGALCGTILAILTAKSSVVNDLLSPMFNIIKATPVSSFILLVLLWLSASLTPMLIAFLMVVPIIWSALRQAIVDVDAELIEMARFFRIPRGRTLKALYIPAIRSQFLAAATTALGFAWKSGVAAEVIATPAFSIGRSIYESKLYLETPELFAWTAAVVLLSVVLEKAFVSIVRRAV